jgi:hypothetical protein
MAFPESHVQGASLSPLMAVLRSALLGHQQYAKQLESELQGQSIQIAQWQYPLKNG